MYLKDNKSKKSNISFVSNINVYSGVTSIRKGNTEFLHKITDFKALKKLRNGPCNGSTNSSYYLFTHKQVEILCSDQNNSFSVKRISPEIEKHNEKLNNEYGYNKYLDNELMPLRDEHRMKYKQSFWENVNIKGEYDDEGEDDKISYWKPVSQQTGTVRVTGGGSLFTTYINQEVERVKKSFSTGFDMPVENVNIDELSKDPYYYIYQKTAGVSKEDEYNIKESDKEAKLYIQKYGLFSAFLNKDQEDIIEAQLSDKIFIDAGPGTGKTYTLINKINYMVNDLDADPEGILVLCFTNAAVKEIRDRRNQYVKDGGDRGLRNVDIRTFHSFAWWLIQQYNEIEDFQDDPKWAPINMSKLSYDSTITKATSIIHRYPELVLGGWEHFIVDEIQDLTDVRARLVLEIIKGCLKVDCGVTVLGDSCQAIYDYNQEDVMLPMDSKKFYKKLFTLLFPYKNFYKLTTNHRQTHDLICLTKELRECILREKKSELKSAVKTLRESIDEIDRNQIVGENGEQLLSYLAEDGKTCLLCRNNGQVLVLSSILRKRGIHHVVNAYDKDRCFAGWISKILLGYDKEQIDRDEFIKLFNKYNNGDHIDSDELWERLVYYLEGGNYDVISIRDMLDMAYISNADDALFHDVQESNIIVSNIHRAKGREYNTVIIEDNFLNRLVTRKQDIGEFKTLYVAVTRPKKHLYRSNMVSTSLRFYPIFSTGRNRWTKFVGSEPKYIEVRGNTDIDIESFNKISISTQKYIADNVKPGDEIILQRSDKNEIFGYFIVHTVGDKSTRIGKITNEFIDDLEAMIRIDDYSQYPAEIRDLYVSNIYTYINPELHSNQKLNIKDNVWMWVDFCGLGRLVYDCY